MQGVFVNYHRPSTKKELKEHVAATPECVDIEGTSIFGNEYDGPITEAPDGEYTVVGPDPYTARNWYATIVKQGKKVTVR